MYGRTVTQKQPHHLKPTFGCCQTQNIPFELIFNLEISTFAQQYLCDSNMVL